MGNAKCMDVLIAERKYWRELPVVLGTIRDRKKRYEISQLTYNPIKYDYDDYSLNQVLFYDSKEDEAGNVFDMPDSRHNSNSNDIVMIVCELLQCLTPTERKVIEMYYYNEKPYRTIADKLKVSKSTIENIVDRALEKMREANTYDRDVLNDFTDTNIYFNSCGMSGISEYFTNECPCKIMSYLQESFGDSKTVCPGSYTDDGRKLLCAKKVTLFDDVPDKFLTIKEAVAALGLPQRKVEQYRETKRLPTTHESLPRNRRIIGSQIVDCGNEVYHYREIAKDKQKYKFDLTKHKQQKHLDKYSISQHNIYE